MPVIEVIVSIKQDGVEIFSTPLHRRVTVAEASGPFISTMLASASYVALPPSVLGEVDMLLIQPIETQTTVRLDAQTDKGIIIQPGGILLLLDGYIVAGTSTNVKLFNNNVDVNIRGIVGGT